MIYMCYGMNFKFKNIFWLTVNVIRVQKVVPESVRVEEAGILRDCEIIVSQ